MSQGHPQQRLSPEQRRRIEEEEERREAERAADLARQREHLQGSELDSYVSRRMERELEAIQAENQRAAEEDLRQSGGAAPQNPYLLLGLGVVISMALVVLMMVMGRR